jgi:hypothetical protein
VIARTGTDDVAVFRRESARNKTWTRTTAQDARTTAVETGASGRMTSTFADPLNGWLLVRTSAAERANRRHHPLLFRWRGLSQRWSNGL